jgi:hypothetical protein
VSVSLCVFVRRFTRLGAAVLTTTDWRFSAPSLADALAIFAGRIEGLRNVASMA